MNINRQIELTCNKIELKDIKHLSYDEMLYLTKHNFYLLMNFITYKYEKRK